jgi:hypothetical protein
MHRWQRRGSAGFLGTGFLRAGQVEATNAVTSDHAIRMMCRRIMSAEHLGPPAAECFCYITTAIRSNSSCMLSRARFVPSKRVIASRAAWALMP